MLQIEAGTMEHGLTPHTHTTCRGLRHLGVHTSGIDYTQKYGGINAIWIPKANVTPETATLVGNIHTLLTLPLQVLIIVVAPATWWDAAGILGLHSTDLWHNGATYQGAGGDTRSHGYVRARVVQNLHATHKWYVAQATVIARLGPRLGKWGLRGLYTPQEYPRIRAREPEPDAISIESGSETSSPPSSPTITSPIKMPVAHGFDDALGTCLSERVPAPSTPTIPLPSPVPTPPTPQPPPEPPPT